MLGYIGFPPHNSTEFYMTNDLGYFHSPSSTFCFVGRASDTVRTGGETVVCAEVEREVTRLDLGLRECAVFGIDDLKSAMGEVRAGAKRQQKQDAICRSATARAIPNTLSSHFPRNPLASLIAGSLCCRGTICWRDNLPLNRKGSERKVGIGWL